MSNAAEYATAIAEAVDALAKVVDTGNFDANDVNVNVLKIRINMAVYLRGGLPDGGTFVKTIVLAVIDDVVDEFGRRFAVSGLADAMADIKAKVTALFP